MLAQKVDTNLTTIRTALRQLERDGLIENVPQWGVRIPVETEEQLKDLYFVRELLEVGAVRRLVEVRDSIAVDVIREKAELCDALASQLPDNVLEFSRAHFDFHLELARQSGSDLLVQSLNRVYFRNWLLWHDLRLWKRRSLINHRKLVEVILGSDEETAVMQMRKHVSLGLKIELDELRKNTASAEIRMASTDHSGTR